MRQIVPYGIGKVNTDFTEFTTQGYNAYIRAFFDDWFHAVACYLYGSCKLFALLCVSIWYYVFTTNGEGEHTRHTSRKVAITPRSEESPTSTEHGKPEPPADKASRGREKEKGLWNVNLNQGSSMNELMLFQKEEFGQVRVVEHNGEP